MVLATPLSGRIQDSAVRDVAWTRARELAHHAARPHVAPVRVRLSEAAGGVLAEDLVTALPGFDTAAMDGFAVAGGGPWRVRGQARAGSAWQGGRLEPECAIRISTGTLVPDGTWAVLPIEDARVDGDWVFGTSLPQGKHIRRAGEDAAAGTCLAGAGTLVGSALLGLAATCGYDELLVRRAASVRAVVTGDELVRHGRPEAGRVRDALGPMLPALIAQLGGRLTRLVHVPDLPRSALRDAVIGTCDADADANTDDSAGSGADVVVVTGSTSVGVGDGLRRLLAECGAQWIVDAVACRPGHPQLLARLPDGPFVVGLPGNPFAALVAAHTLLGPLLAGLAGRPLPRLPHAPLAGPVKAATGKTRLVPVVWDGGAVLPLRGDRPAFLNGAALGDALAAVPPDAVDGQPVPLVLLNQYQAGAPTT